MTQASRQKPASSAVPDNLPRPAAESQVNILIVDDEPRNLDALEAVLQPLKHRLVRAQSAEEALRALVSEDFAVLVLDIRMPGMSGLELAQIIKQRKKTRQIPIIFLTAYYPDDEHILQGYNAGAVDYLSKPCNPSILCSKVNVFVDLFRKSRELEAEVEVRRQAEGRIRDLNAELTQRLADLAATNAELEAFSYSVSHDLRAPLRQVSGFIALLQKAAGPLLDGEAGEYIPLIKKSVIRMGRLIDDLLEFSRMGRTEMSLERIKLQDLLHQAIQALSPQVEGRPIEWSIASLPEIRGDAAMLRQVLINLIDNAIKFTRTRSPARIEIGCATGPGEDVVYVRDNGVGFDTRYADKLFGVFQRLHSSGEFEGTGIGLASVRRIIQRHGGRTWAESALDQGTTMYFSLPHSSPSTLSLSWAPKLGIHPEA